MEQLIHEASRLGLLADIFGAILIGKAVFFVKNKDIFGTSGAAMGYSRYQTKEKIAAKVEAISGSVFLVVGFLGQYIGTDEGNTNGISVKLDVGFFATCIALFILVIVGARQYATIQTDKLIKAREAERK